MLVRILQRWIGQRVLPIAAVLAAAVGCSEDPVVPAPGIAALVGDWSAGSLVLTNVANPTVAPDLIELGAAFDLNIQPSGQYTAILVFALQSSTEIGQITVSGSNITLSPTFPPGQPSTTGTYSLVGDRLVIDGTSQFDFNTDGDPEPALAHFEFARK